MIQACGCKIPSSLCQPRTKVLESALKVLLIPLYMGTWRNYNFRLSTCPALTLSPQYPAKMIPCQPAAIQRNVTGFCGHGAIPTARKMSKIAPYTCRKHCNGYTRKWKSPSKYQVAVILLCGTTGPLFSGTYRIVLELSLLGIVPLK